MLSPIGNKKVKQRKEAFIKLVTEHKDKTWYVCNHDNPDPDSIASTLGIATLLRFLGVENVEVVYCGEVSQPQNRAMINVLNIGITKWEEISGKVQKDDSKFIFADCSYGQKNMSIKETPAIVIDHHKIITNNKDILFIHDEIGSCSTLVFDLMLTVTSKSDDEEETVVQCFDPDEDGIEELATALSIGIKTDTLDFLAETTTDSDVQAFRLLSAYLNKDKFQKVVNYEFPPYVLDFEQIAWGHKNEDYQPHFITGLGYMDELKSDCIPTIADKFMRLEGVQTVVVYALVGGTIRGSVRTSSSTLDCQTLCDEIFGKGNGGAKHGIGGARVAFNVFDPSEMDQDSRDSLWTLTKIQIEGKFRKATTK